LGFVFWIHFKRRNSLPDQTPLASLSSRHLLHNKSKYRRNGAEGHDSEAKTDGETRFSRSHIDQKTGAKTNKKNYSKAHNPFPVGDRFIVPG